MIVMSFVNFALERDLVDHEYDIDDVVAADDDDDDEDRDGDWDRDGDEDGD